MKNSLQRISHVERCQMVKGYKRLNSKESVEYRHYRMPVERLRCDRFDWYVRHLLSEDVVRVVDVCNRVIKLVVIPTAQENALIQI